MHSLLEAIPQWFLCNEIINSYLEPWWSFSIPKLYGKTWFFSLNCDQIPSSEIQSLVLKPCNYPRWPIMAMAPNNFKSFTTTHPVKSCSCLQSPHYPIFQVLLAFCSTKYSASTINNDANIAHKSKTSREENPLWKKNVAQAGKQAVHLYTCCLSVSSLYWISK